MLSWIRNWLEACKEKQRLNEYINYEKPYTVCCDTEKSWYPLHKREKLILVKGVVEARRISRRWMKICPKGKTKIIVGHHKWDN